MRTQQKAAAPNDKAAGAASTSVLCMTLTRRVGGGAFANVSNTSEMIIASVE